MSTDALDRHLAFQERIDRAKQMVRRAEETCRHLQFGDHTLGEMDPDGHVRRCVRALLPLAVKDPSFDVTISLGTNRSWGVRLQNIDHAVDLTAVFLESAAEPALDDIVPAAAGHEPDDPESAEDDVISALADLLRG